MRDHMSYGKATEYRAAAMILAAGAATRMGRIKQLLPYREGTLLTNAINQAVTAGFDPVVTVLGCQADVIGESIRNLPVHIAHNEHWQEGMGSSISSGMQFLESRQSDIDLVAVLLADQPGVAANHLCAMREQLASGDAPAIAAYYNGQPGVPAMFRRAMFPLLRSLAPDAGARHILRDPQFPVASFALDEAAMDIDTPADFAALQEVRP
jgi:molybdenum cofactor cytidylyltransferase